MNSTESITYISIAVIIVSLFFIGTKLTGYASANDTAVVNVTISQTGVLEFTTDTLNFGTGAVNTAADTAILVSNGTVTNGTWTPIDGQLVLENKGNVNVSLELIAESTVDEFYGVTGGSFDAMVANNETGSCTGTNVFTAFYPLNTTQQTACGTAFSYHDTYDRLNVDVRLVIPKSAVGAKGMTIKAIGLY